MLSICCCCYCCWQWWWWCPVNEKLDEIIYFNWNSCKLQSQDNGNYYQLGVDLFEQVMDEYKFVLMGLTCALQIQLNSRFHYMAILSCTSSTSKHAGCTGRQSESVPSIVIGFLSSYLGIGNYLYWNSNWFDAALLITIIIINSSRVPSEGYSHLSRRQDRQLHNNYINSGESVF